MRGPFTILPLMRDEATPGRYAAGDPLRADTVAEARHLVRECYARHGVIPDVLDGGNRAVQVFTNEEVGNWGRV